MPTHMRGCSAEPFAILKSVKGWVFVPGIICWDGKEVGSTLALKSATAGGQVLDILFFAIVVL